MSNTPEEMVGEMEEDILPEFCPSTHPDIIFRAHPTQGRHSIIFLGGEEYWVQGTWTAQTDGRMVILQDRVFRISEFLHAIPGVEFRAEAAESLPPFH